MKLRSIGKKTEKSNYFWNLIYMNILLRQLYSTFPINIIIPMLLILSLSVHDNLVKEEIRLPVTQ